MERNSLAWDRIIVEIVPGHYVRSQALYKMYAPGWQPAWTPHVWDAKSFSSRSTASKIAAKVGGRVRAFDALEGRVYG